MWKPEQRIRYENLTSQWPDADAASRAALFSPLAYQNLSLRHRSWVPAMVPWRAKETGEVTEDVVDWYRRFAQGRPGALVVEATGIRDIPSGPLLRIGHDRFLPGLEKIVHAVREASEGQTRLFIQLIDFLPIRRRPDRDKYIRRFLPVTDAHYAALGLPQGDEAAVRSALGDMTDEALADVLTPREMENLQRGYRQRVTDMDVAEVASLPEQMPDLFADAALRAQKAGFDGVELHYAHAYTMASFLSRLNTRDDGYGGSREARCRLPLEVYGAVRQACPAPFVVGCRMLTEETIDGGSELADATYYARRFAEAGMDFISLSRGGKFEDAKQPRIGEAIYPYTGRSGYECMPQIISDELGPFGRNAAPAASIKLELKSAGLETPLVLAGGIHVFEQAERYLQDGTADIIGFARQALADPDWFIKVLSGKGETVRLCSYTNYCEGLDQKHKMVTCQLWDRLELDAPDVKKTPDGKRRTTAP